MLALLALACGASHAPPRGRPAEDGDGIAGPADLCPRDPEDRDGWEDEDGCPDPDNDHDRVVDQDDHCPNDAEVYNGTDDDDGCPDHGRVALYEPPGVAPKVFFRSGSARVEDEARPTLEAVAAVLAAHPEIVRVGVVGHASAEEPDGPALAHARAEAVQRRLGELGVAPGRLAVDDDPSPPDASTPEAARFVEFRAHFAP